MVSTQRTVLPRSFLYVPGIRSDFISKALTGAADALLLDLEDSVALAAKVAARQVVAESIAGADFARPTPELWVRINSEFVELDLDAVVMPGLAGVFLAKCGVASLDQAAARLTVLENVRGLPSGSIGIIGLVEDAAALVTLPVMATHPRILTFGIGEVDLLASLRIERGPRTLHAVDAIRARIVIECAAAACLPPVAPTSTDFSDLEAFRESSLTMLDLGFRSRTAVHPSQISVIHDVFTPQKSQVTAALDLIARLDESGGGVALDAYGRLVDAAVVRSAREVLQRAAGI